MKVIIDSKHLNQTGENLKIDLQDIIDNRNDEYVVAARDISYYVGYYNISKALGNNHAVYSDRKITNNVFLPRGLYTLQQYFDVIKNAITTVGGDASYISYSYSSYDGKITIFATASYTFSIIDSNKGLLGFKDVIVITMNSISKRAVNFLQHKILYVHLKQIKNNHNHFNGIKTDILAKVAATNDEFGTLVQYKVDSPYFILLENTTINSLELSITDENNKIIDFYGIPIYYTLEISKKNNL